MACSTDQRPRSNSLKAKDENDLYKLLIHASKELKCRFKLTDSKIKESSLELRHQIKHKGWNNSDGIDYDDMSLCCAYLEGYAICHAALAKQATEWFLRKIKATEIEKTLFQKESMKVVFVGGGPGNDMLGFCSAIKGTRRTFKELEMSVVDLKSGWKDVFEETISTARSLQFGKAGDLLEDDDVQVTLNFLPADLTYEMVDEIREADLVVMVKVLSNVPSSSRSKMLKNIFSTLKDGTVFLYIDMLASKVERQANQPHSNMKVLFTKKHHWFKLSIGKKDRKNILTESSYEICVLQKEFNSDSNANDSEDKGVESTDEESSEDDMVSSEDEDERDEDDMGSSEDEDERDEDDDGENTE